MSRPSQGLTIGDLADRTGLAVSAIRFYETKGLVAPVRNHGGHRRYDRSDIRKLSFVMIAQELGFSLARIAALLKTLPDGRPPTRADWSRMSKEFRTEIDDRIAGLERLSDTLDGCIGCGCLSLDRCGLHNPADTARTLGPGPRYLMADSTTSGKG
ncbi:redox-sensitive transcriptional activator SoxR [Aestuariibius insulae]|uniref:redox-sensitive transcriptional activator SoxR n=1 Tax=Aestuariibius insulae TaxID=2058287 RepID=UPI00345E0925